MDERQNNFDLLRLFAATQVVYFHVLLNLEVDPSNRLAPVSAILELFPGVPIFFVISGYLISLSYERNPKLRGYFVNRFLRIYPGLWVCFAVLLVAITLTGGWSRAQLGSDTFLTWISMQLSIGQFWSPHELKTVWGVGHTNGSLWTIPVELQFYLLVPILFWVIFRISREASNFFIVALICIFMAIQRAYVYFAPVLIQDYETAVSLFRVSFFPWFYMFLIGVLLQRNRAAILPHLHNRGHFLLVIYIVLALTASNFGASLGNNISPLLSPVLAVTVIALAYTRGHLSQRLLHGHDISYGVYIYHMVIVNTLFELGWRGSLWAGPIAFVATAFLSWASWILIERPALRLKRYSLRPVEKTKSSR